MEGGEPAGFQMAETKRIYYMKLRWLNKSGHGDDAIPPLALKWYYDGKMYTKNNECESDDEEGVKTFFYNKKEETEDEYKYATMWTIKTDKTVGGGPGSHSVYWKSQAGSKYV
jgi:hypothetical protein